MLLSFEKTAQIELKGW